MTTLDLAMVQARRGYAAALTQLLQLAVQRALVRRVLAGQAVHVPAVLDWLRSRRFVRALVARLLGKGIRPEHWRGATETRRRARPRRGTPPRVAASSRAAEPRSKR